MHRTSKCRSALSKKVEAREVDFYNTSGAEPSSPPQVSDTSIRAAKLEISKQNHSNVEVFAASKPDRMSDAGAAALFFDRWARYEASHSSIRPKARSR
jgi:hypothetical protein